LIQNANNFSLPSPSLDEMLLFIRAGSIFARKDTPRRSSTAMRFDPFTLVVALNPTTGQAEGSLYCDDEESFDYREKGEFTRIYFTAALGANQILSLEVGRTGDFTRTGMKISKLIIAHVGGVKEIKTDISLTSNNAYEIKL
jgi:alpha 1,3-glucosidase